MERIGNNLEFHFKNIGYVKEGSLELGDLTIIGGLNNTGKTYINYCIYGFFHAVKDLIDSLFKPLLSTENTYELLVKKTITIDILDYLETLIAPSFWENISDRYSSMLFDLYKVEKNLC